jgi:predicted hotdog family 3-hydroxylacyl-ACP dehydratase
MLLIREIVAHAPPYLSCRAVVGHDCPLVSEGTARSVIALELIAQCAAVSAGLAAQARGERVVSAAVVAARSLRLHVGTLPVGAELVVETRHVGGGLDAAGFEGTVRSPDGTLLAEASLTVVGRSAPR